MSEKLRKFYEAAGVKCPVFDMPYVKPYDLLPETPQFLDHLKHSFVSYEDFFAFVKNYTPASAHEDKRLMNDALVNSDFLIANFKFSHENFIKLTNVRPDILIQSQDEFIGGIKLYQELFYFEPSTMQLIFENIPEILQFTKTQILHKVTDLSFVMQVSRYSIFDLFHKYPKLLFWSQESLQNYLTVVAKIFKCHQGDLRNAIFNYPEILEIPLEKIEELYTKVYAKGFTRLELRQIFIQCPYNLLLSPESILEKIEQIMTQENMTLKEVTTLIGDCAFILPLSTPYSYFWLEKKYRMDRKFLKRNQYKFQFPHENFIFKYVFSRTVGIEMQFSKIANIDTKKLFARYFFLKEKLGRNCNFSRDLSITDIAFKNKYQITAKELFEKYPLTKEKLERLFTDYNSLDGYKFNWFYIPCPEDLTLSPVYYEERLLKDVLIKSVKTDLPKENIVTLALDKLGFTIFELEFLVKTIRNINYITVNNIHDIYDVFRKFDFTLEETNWLVLHNPAILNYHKQALQNRLIMISKFYNIKCFCSAWPERI